MPVNNPPDLKTIRLNDTAGSDSWKLEDAQGVPVFKVDSTGQRHTKKGVERLP